MADITLPDALHEFTISAKALTGMLQQRSAKNGLTSADVDDLQQYVEAVMYRYEEMRKAAHCEASQIDLYFAYRKLTEDGKKQIARVLRTHKGA